MVRYFEVRFHTFYAIDSIAKRIPPEVDLKVCACERTFFWNECQQKQPSKSPPTIPSAAALFVCFPGCASVRIKFKIACLSIMIK